MNVIENTYDLDMIETSHKIHAYCPIGQATYTGKINIQFTPDKVIPDYIELDKAIKELNDTKLLIEDMVNKICEIISKLEPISAVVTITVDDALHCPVKITKSI